MAEMWENAGHVETTLTSPAYMKSNDRNVNVSTQMLKNEQLGYVSLNHLMFVFEKPVTYPMQPPYATAYVEPTPLHEVSPMSLSGVTAEGGPALSWFPVI